VDYVADTRQNPFGLRPACEQFVPGFGDPNAHFHVVGDHPGVHGGLSTGIPFTGRPWSELFFETLRRGGLIRNYDVEAGTVDCPRTFFSYVALCPPSDGDTPTAAEYDRLEPFFDAELRAITAHVLFPVGEHATGHVFETCTAESTATLEMDRLHATEVRGSGWLVVPITDPANWRDRDRERLLDTLEGVCNSDYRQISDLGRFLPGEESYYVR
jgi:uracil-DNA glycosylase family 4